MLTCVTTNFILIFIIILLSRLQYIHYQAVKSQVWQRDDRISNSLEGEREWGCCATPLVSESCAVVYPRVHPSGITRGYAWCVPAGDGGCILGSSLSSIFPPRVHPFKHPRRGRWVSETKYNKGAGWRNKAVSWQPYCICKRNKGIHATAYRTKTLGMKKLHQNSSGGAIYRLVSFPL